MHTPRIHVYRYNIQTRMHMRIRLSVLRPKCVPRHASATSPPRIYIYIYIYICIVALAQTHLVP